MIDTYEARLARFKEQLQGSELDAFIVFGAENRRYLSGFSAEDGGIDESAGALWIADRRCLLATDSRYTLQAQAEAPQCEIIRYRRGMTDVLPEMVRGWNGRRIGFEGRRLAFQTHEKICRALADAQIEARLVACDDLVEDLRAVKEPGEIEAIRAALAIAEDAFERIVDRLRPGMTEKEAAWMLEREMRETGAEGVSFPVICAAGPNSALPHAVPGDRRIAPSEPILFDWGARLDGYCSDTSRTWVLGPPDEMFQKVYTVVREAQRRAIGAIRPGADTRTVDAAARDYIHARGFEGRFGHSLGHGTGLAVHEKPALGPTHANRLTAGMVVTVEPGIYLPDWGGVRLENQVLVTEDGARVLNRLGFPWE